MHIKDTNITYQLLCILASTLQFLGYFWLTNSSSSSSVSAGVLSPPSVSSNCLILTGAFTSSSCFLAGGGFFSLAGSGLGGSGLLTVRFGRDRTAGGGEGDLAIFFSRAKGGDGLLAFFFDFIGGGGEGLFALRLGAGDVLFDFFLDGGGDGLFNRLFCILGGGEGDRAFLLGVFFFGGGTGLGERCLLPLLVVNKGTGSGDGDLAFRTFFISDFF